MWYFIASIVTLNNIVRKITILARLCRKLSMTQKQYKLFNVIISRNIIWPILGLWGKRESFFLENFLTCGNLKVHGYATYQVFWPKSLGKICSEKFEKVTSLLWGGTCVDGYTWLVERKLRVTQSENYLHIRCEGHFASCDSLELSYWCVFICVHWNKGLDLKHRML